MGAVETGRDDLGGRGMFEQVAGELLDEELVERQVAVEGGDDPLTIRPDFAIVVEMEAVGIAVACGVEPEPRQVFAVVRRARRSSTRCS